MPAVSLLLRRGAIPDVFVRFFDASFVVSLETEVYVRDRDVAAVVPALGSVLGIVSIERLARPVIFRA